MRKFTIIGLAFVILSGPAMAGTFVDQRGKSQTFDTPVSRVVTIAIPQFWVYMAVDGGPQKIVGANPTAVAQMRPSLLAKIYPDAVNVPTGVVRGGFVPNVEELLRLKPDVVFQWADRGDDLITSLESVGLKTVGVKNTGNETDFAQWVTMMGETDGRQDRVATMLKDREAAVARLSTAIGSVPDSEKPRVLSLNTYSKALVADGNNSYPDIFIRRAGGLNVAGSIPGSAGNANISMEQVLTWKPDIIYLSQFEDKTPADLMADPIWASVPAVQTKRVYKLPFGGSRWGGADQETPLFWIWLARLQHPGKFDVDLVAEMKQQYRFLYQYDLSEDDIARVLQASQNGTSANYGQFAAH